MLRTGIPIKISLFSFIQFILPLVVIVVFQQMFQLTAEIILGHLLVILCLNLTIIGLGFMLFSKKTMHYHRFTTYLIAGLFGILNVLLYYTYLFAFFGKHFNSKVFTLQIILGYLKYLDQFIQNFEISPILVYGILIFIPIVILIAILSLRNTIKREVLGLKNWIQKNRYNNPTRLFKYTIVGFLLSIGFLVGVVFSSYSKIPYYFFSMEEPVTTFFLNKDPFDGRILSDENEDVGVRSAYPKDIQFDKKNVVVIVIDALRSDHLSLFGYERQTSPFLDSLYASGDLRKMDLSFSNAAESFAGINAILRSKIWAHLGYNNFSLPELLKDQGYDLNFLVSGDHTNFSGLKSFYGQNSDFSSYIDGSMSTKHSDPNDDQIIFEGLEHIPMYDKSPSYFHFHLMSVHNLGVRLNTFKTYTPAYRTIFDAENYINRYDNGVLQVDTYLKQIFRRLTEKGYLQKSIVVITGDHGEALGERELFGHSRNIYTNQILTPILIYDSEKVEYKNLKYATSIDIAPTIVDRLGLPIPETWEGVSLYSEVNNGKLSFHQQGTYYAIISSKDDRRYKLIYDSRTGQQELYDLNSDLYEKTNIIDSLDVKYVNTLRWYMTEFNLDYDKIYHFKPQ